MPETIASQYAEHLKDSQPMAACQTMEVDQSGPFSLYPSSPDAAAVWFFIPPDSTEIYQVSVQRLADPYLLNILS